MAVIAKRFVLHPNTVRAWIQAVEGRGNERLLSPAVAWNRIDDLVRWAVHELRRLCPEPEYGTRTIARHLMRRGLQIARTTIQRVQREPRPAKPRPHRPEPVAAGVEPHHLLTPTQPNEVWHVDLTTLRILWMSFTVMAVHDGFSRRLLALRVHARTPRTDHAVALIHGAADEYGIPRFVITDHGSHFRKRFGAAMKKAGIHHVQGQVRKPFLNGKIERLFRSFQGWWRLVLPLLTVSGLQRKLDNFRGWYNELRVHAALGARTPNEVAQQTEVPTPIPIRQRDHCITDIQIKLRPCRGDPRLPIIDIAVQLRRAA